MEVLGAGAMVFLSCGTAIVPRSSAVTPQPRFIAFTHSSTPYLPSHLHITTLLSDCRVQHRTSISNISTQVSGLHLAWHCTILASSSKEYVDTHFNHRQHVSRSFSLLCICAVLRRLGTAPQESGGNWPPEPFPRSVA
jgi:hypothetical protein